MARRIEIKPTGTIARRQCQAELIDGDGMHLASIPARYEGQGTTASPHYVVLDIDAVEATTTTVEDSPTPLTRDELIGSNRALRASRAHAWKHVEAVHELLRLILDEMADATVADLAADGNVGDEEGQVWKKIAAEAERIRQALDTDEPLAPLEL